MARWFIHEPNTAPIAPQSCSCGSCGKGCFNSRSTSCLVDRDHLAPILGGELGVERLALVELVVLERVLEMLVVDAQHDLAVHLDEAAIAVIGEARVAAALGEALRPSCR